MSLQELKYDFVTAPLLAAEENVEPAGDGSNFYKGEVDKGEVTAEQHDMDALGEFVFAGADLQQARQLAEDTDSLQKGSKPQTSIRPASRPCSSGWNSSPMRARK